MTIELRELDRDLTFDRLHVVFVDKEGERHEFEVAAGDNLLDIAQSNDLEMEGKAEAATTLVLY